MEGRMSRDELIKSSADTEGYRTQVSGGGSYSRPSSSYRGYTRDAGRGYHRRYAKKDYRADGADLFVVQLMASGVLLLLVMLVAAFSSGGTAEIAKKLDGALAKNTTFDEVKSGFFAARESFSGGVGSVLEIFGGEIDGVDGDRTRGGDGSLAEVNPSQAGTGASSEPSGNGVSVDAETLNELYELSEDYPKN